MKVSDKALAERIYTDKGGKIVADYGAFQILEVDARQVAELMKNPSVSKLVDSDCIYLNAERIITSSLKAKAQMAKPMASFPGKQLHLVQFAGPIKPEWYQSLESSGLKVVSYIPENAYLVYGDSQGINSLRKQALNSRHILWEGAYEDAYKIQPDTRSAINASKGIRDKSMTGMPDGYTLQLVEDPQANAHTIALIEKLRRGPIAQDEKILGYRNLTVSLAPADIEVLAGQPDVVSIGAWLNPKLHCERQNMILSGNVTTVGSTVTPSGPGYLTWLAGKGFSQGQFDTSDFAVDVTDSGLDNATTDPNHFGLRVAGDVANASRVLYARLEGTANPSSTIQGCDGHGNLNTHIIAGYNDYSFTPQVDGLGFHYGLGVCPFVKVGSSVIFDPGTYTSPIIPDLISRAYRDKARISSNSWGANSAVYSATSQTYDALVRDAQPATSAVPVAGNQEMVIVFSAGNAGPGAGTIGRPANAKNLIAVGASEDVNPFGGADNCGEADTGADNAMDMATFSSRGPSADGRIRPDIVAPGTHVSGGVFQATKVNPTSGATGTAATCFDGSGVCGGPSGSNFFPTTQQWFSASSGTSHSCPAVSGACALLRQYFINHGWSVPSPAMTKAYLMNSTRYMTGLGANDNLFSNSQGMGLLDLGRGFDGVARILRDQQSGDMFTATGESRVITGTVSSASEPFRVTLAWTDAPGSTTGNAYNNNLDLSVTINGQTYKGNVFTGANSATGGSADVRNNVESVFIPAGVTGNFSVTVSAANINSIGVPGAAGTVNQDYALVIYNGTEVTMPVMSLETATLTAESCAPANTVPDPAENVSYRFVFKNVGTGAASNVTVSLAATGGVLSPTGTQTLGAMAAGASANADFTFQVDPALACGGTFTATFTVMDGATNMGTFTRTFTLGGTTSANYSSGALTLAIADNSSTNATQTVAAAGTVRNLKVKVRINHTWDSDLRLSLISPTGTTVSLFNKRGSSGDNLGSGATDCTGTFTVFSDAAATAISAGTAPFAGTYRPEAPLSALNGETLTGTWTLRLEDTVTADTGTLYCWQLENDSPACCTTVVDPPTISSFTPTSGPVGTSVVITGTYLTGATAVSFNGTAATSYTVDSATQITAVVPGGATTGTIQIVTPGGTVTSAGTFTVVVLPPTITSFSPTSGSYLDSVVITGTNFLGATAVSFNGTAATSYTVDSPTQITVAVPVGATTGTIEVVTPGGTVTSTGTFTVVVTPPTITSFTPTSGAIGTSVVITGTRFTGATAVRFNGTAATSYTVNSATQITVVVPVGATTGTIEVVTPNGSVTSTGSFTVVPVSVTLSPKPLAVLTGASVTFTASVLGAPNVNVTWTASAGTPSTGGASTSFTWTAPATAGSATITATSVYDVTKSDSATILIKSLDLNVNGSIDVADMAVLSAAYGSISTDPNYNALADLSGDATVNDTDVTLWLNNF